MIILAPFCSVHLSLPAGKLKYMGTPSTSQQSLRIRNRWLAAFLVFGMAVWLLGNLPHNSLWYDEALTTYVATHSWQELLRWCTQVDIQVPLHYIVLRFWTMFVGDSEFSLRLLSAFCALLAAAATMAIGQKLSRPYTAGAFLSLTAA